MIEHQILAFGEFTLKSGRVSPYFFNLGEINTGAGLAALGGAYARAIVDQELVPDVVFGPAYKGIPIAVATALALHRDHAVDVGVAYNRKEAKAHGEGGSLVGAPLAGRILVVDDVMTAGTAVAEAARLVHAAGAELSAVLVALDRQETVDGGASAVQKISREMAVAVHSIATLGDVISSLDLLPGYRDALAKMRSYQQKHCVLT